MKKNNKGASATRNARPPRENHVAEQNQPWHSLILAFIVRLGFYLLTPAEKVVRARSIIGSMTGNPYFPAPVPTLADLQTAVDALELAQQALPGGPDDTEIRNLRERELDVMMSNLQNYVEFTAQGDPEMVLSSGMELRDPRSPVGILPPTETVIARPGVASGSVKLKWKPVRKSSGYRVEATEDPSQGWPMVYNVEKASLKIFGLTPGTKYYFRVATLSHAGYEGYSPVASMRATFAQD